MSPHDPEYATLRDLVNTVKDVDDKLDQHKLDTEKRLGRIEKGVLFVGLLAILPHFTLKSVPLLEGAVHGISHIL